MSSCSPKGMNWKINWWFWFSCKCRCKCVFYGLANYQCITCCITCLLGEYLDLNLYLEYASIMQNMTAWCHQPVAIWSLMCCLPKRQRDKSELNDLSTLSTSVLQRNGKLFHLLTNPCLAQYMLGFWPTFSNGSWHFFCLWCWIIQYFQFVQQT